MSNTMSNPHEFGGTMYDTPEARNRAMCQSYLTADGWNDADDVRLFFEESHDAGLAAEMLRDWPDDHMTEATATLIFADLREDQSWLAD